MATQAELKRERELLAGFGLNPVRTWSARTKWYKEDGSYYGELPSDMYSRLRYMERGLRPELTESDSLHLDVRRKVESMRHNDCLPLYDRHSRDDFRLASAVNYLVTRSDDYWRGTATLVSKSREHIRINQIKELPITPIQTETGVQIANK